MRKFTLIFLFLSLVFYSRAYDFTDSNGISYTIKSSAYKLVSVANGTSVSGSVTIPSTITISGQTYTVQSIGSSAFLSCTTLSSIVLPNTITSIEYQAFFGCSGLSYIDIPNSVTSIGSSAFTACYGLSTVLIPSSVSAIGTDVFQNCTKLTTINVEANNLYYSSADGVLFNKNKTTLIAYPYNKTVTSYSIPNTVTTIGEKAFNTYYGLTSITIPNSVVTIGNGAFMNCSFSSIDLPNSVITIGNNAFTNCSQLNSITIPSSVTSIGYSAFELCAKLSSINVASANINYSSADGVFFNKDQTVLIYYPMGNISTNYTIPSTVKSIANGAFEYCSKLTSISFPISVTSIGSGTFMNCTGLTSITLPTYLSSIDTYAFGGCTNLKTINIPYKTLTLANGIFNGCSGLTAIHAKKLTPVNLTSILDIFTNVPVNTCTLYIPTGSKSLYQAADKWNTFTNMVEESPDCILSTNAVSLSGNGETKPVNMVTPIAWTVKSNQDWVTISPTSGTEDASLAISAVTNPTIKSRTATVSVYYGQTELQSITVTQNPGPPTLSVTPSSTTLNKKVSTVAISSNSPWTVSSDQSWLALNTTAGDGNTTLTLTADVNLSTSQRTATITVSVSPSLSKTIIVTQEAATLTLSANTLNVKAGKGSIATTNVTSNVTWTATSDQSWLVLNSTAGDGNATLTLTAETNLSTSTRTATVTVAVSPSLSRTITVTQDAATLTITDTNLNIQGASGSKVSGTISTNVAWTATTNQQWVVLSATSGDGNTQLTFTADVNMSTSQRSATITVTVTPTLTKTITITQQPYIIATVVKKWNNILICDNSQKKFASFQWYKNGDIIANAIKQYYREGGSLSAGNYSVKVTTTDGTTGISNTLSTTTMSKVVELYPNMITVNQSSLLSINAQTGDLTGGKLSISTLSGQLVQQNNTLIDKMTISGLPSGNYVIRVTLSDGSTYNEKLIIK
jgi:hypothetical protein